MCFFIADDFFSRLFLPLIKRKRHSEINPNILLKTPESTRVLRKTYGILRAQGHIDNEAIILVRAGEKLAAENKILRKENEGLKGAIFEEKRKRKREKALIFHNKGKTEG